MVKLTNDASLSAFQQACIDDLACLAKDGGVAIERVDAFGSTERYVIVEFGVRELTVWIYVDECMLTSGGKSFYFEKADFTDERHLKDAFLSAAASLLQGDEPTQRGSARINLFMGRRL